jgi:hypothetical protein
VGANQQAPSFGSMFLKYGGGVAVMLGLLALFSLVSGMQFEFGSAGTRGGVPLTSSGSGVALLMAVGVGCWWLGTRWDAPRFVAFRSRRRWLVPVVIIFVVFPGLLAALFAMLQ